MKGYVSDIQRFSLKDGPGIRTTVFLQGCNMKCAWCHNPETIGCSPQLLFYEKNCIHCGKCIPVCPTGALHILDNRIQIDRGLCKHCGACAKICFPGALILSCREMEAQEILAEVVQDIDYYRNSGGGITLSGGEILMQSDFAFEILSMCRERGISTAIETNLNAEWSRLERLLAVTDLVMCDIKHMDTGKHRKWTGAGNELILQNIKNLAQSQIPVIVRTPVIPGVNNTPEEIEAIAFFAAKAGLNLLYYELLRFNPLGDAKYEALDAENVFCREKPETDEEMDALKRAAEACNISVRAD